MNKAVLFTNWTNEDFIGMWDMIEYLIPAKQSRMLEEFLANHFAKHLTDKEMMKAGLTTDHHTRQQYVDKCFSDVSINAANSTKLGAEMANYNINVGSDKMNNDMGKPSKVAFCDSCDSKGVRHKKDCVRTPVKAVKMSTPEQAFAGMAKSQK